MRYSLLDLIACQQCFGPLTCLTHTEAPISMPPGLFPDGTRVSAGPGVGPVPTWRTATALSQLLDRVSQPAAPSERSRAFEVATGLLICGGCGRWYPIEGTIPELLPDHLRDLAREARLFDTFTSNAPEELRRSLAVFKPSGDAASDPGAHYKKAEIAIKSKIEDPVFFGPGYSSPFNPWNTDFTLYLIALFGMVIPVLNVKRGQCVIDSGCGYSWSTEWLFRSGVDSVGVDICRTYLEIGIGRMGPFRPHLVVGDVENLPLAGGCADAILAYESFHHVPDRHRALASYDRALKEDGTVVLAEPGAAHESADVSVDAMQKYGILEKGMELEDVRAYARGTSFRNAEQLYVLRLANAELGIEVDATAARQHSAIEGNLFRLIKGDRRAPSSTERIGRGLKRRLKAVLRLGFA
jgi:uncharacterized protein YbaR (Trm112 family)/SAM-dependent methyltransferase